MIRPNDTPRSPSTRQRTRSAAAADAAALTQWQHVVDVLEDAARACDARADPPVEPQQGHQGHIGQDERLSNRLIWLLNGETVQSAADQLRLAAPARLPDSFPTRVTGPAGPAGAVLDEAEADPLPLLEKAWEQLELIPDDPTNVELLVATFAVADALAAVRSHYPPPL